MGTGVKEIFVDVSGSAGKGVGEYLEAPSVFVAGDTPVPIPAVVIMLLLKRDCPTAQHVERQQ